MRNIKWIEFIKAVGPSINMNDGQGLIIVHMIIISSSLVLLLRSGHHLHCIILLALHHLYRRLNVFRCCVNGAFGGHVGHEHGYLAFLFGCDINCVLLILKYHCV